MAAPDSVNAAMTGQGYARVAVDNWYAEALIKGSNNGRHCGTPTAGVVSINELLAGYFSPAVLRLARFAWLRGLLWFLATRRMERIICTFSSKGVGMFLLLESLFGAGRKRVYFVEYLRPMPHGFKAALKERLHVLVFSWLFRRTLAGVHVMTKWEREAYSRRFNLPIELYHFLSFPMMLQPNALPPAPADGAPVVMVSGRAACDWPTVFAAAQGASWRLLVVCAKSDAPMVSALNADGRATVLSEIPAAEHQRLLLSSTVYALVLHEIFASSGQVRLARAIEAGVPVVATAVRGLEGYLENGVTGYAVPVGDAAALRRALDSLVTDRSARLALRERAYEAMRGRTLECFVEGVKRFALN